jgi:hypothetical protein
VEDEFVCLGCGLLTKRKLKQEEPYADVRDLWKQNARGALIAALGQPHQILQDFDGFAEFSSAHDTPRTKLENENRYLGYRL